MTRLAPLLLIAFVTLRAQVPGTQMDSSEVMDAQPAPVGTGVISGTVVNGQTRMPIRKANVNLNGPVGLSAVTDSSGAFTFRALPAGDYFVNATHQDYATGPGAVDRVESVKLADGEEKSGVEISLRPTATMSGRVLDDEDAPIANCTVTAAPAGSTTTRRRFYRGMYRSQTDSEGLFRLHGMPQGRYGLVAQCNATYPAPHGFMRRNDPMIPHEGYAPALYGGDASSPGSGIAVTSGADLAGVDFHLKLVPVFVLRGNIGGLDSTLMPNVSISVRDPNAPANLDEFRAVRYDPGEGRFTFRNIPAGSYEITATVLNPEHVYQARQTVEVGKTQITEVNLRMSPGAALSGTVEFEDPSQRLDNLQFQLNPLSEDYRGPYPTATIKEDNTFLFKGVLPGHFRLNLPTGYAKSVTLAGRSVAPGDFELGSGDSGPMQIVIGSKPAKVTVEVAAGSAAGQTVTAVLLPADPTDSSGRNNLAMGTGTLQISDVPPGKYRLFVLATPDPSILFNSPDLAHRLESRSVEVDLAEDDDKKIAAQVISAEDVGKAEADEQ